MMFGGGLPMASDWFDELLGGEPEVEDDPLGAFYCPYTNASECALMTKGWQPQELCDVLDCEQLKLFDRRSRRRDEAA